MSRWATSLISLATLVAAWAFAAQFASSRHLPGPATVLEVTWHEAMSGPLFHHLGITLLRVVASFVLAMVVGMLIGLTMGRRRRIDRFFDPWLILLLNLPALVVIVFCYLWIGINEVAAVLAVAINKIPNVATTMREGARALDPALDDVAAVFRFSPLKRFSAIVWPQLEPFLAASVRTGLALIWKIVLVVELLGRSNGVGFQINLYFQLFDIAHIMAYSLSFMAVVTLIETFVVKPWERRASAWRQHA